MLFSWIKKYLSSLMSIIKFLFECTLLVTILSYGMQLYIRLNAPVPSEKTHLVRRLIGQSDSGSTDLAEYRGSAGGRPDLEFSRLQESRYSAMGYGIDPKDWDAYVDQLHLVYKLSPEVVGILRLCRYQQYGQFEPSSFFELDRSSGGEGDYVRLISERKNGKINFILAGNRVNFGIAPIREVLRQTGSFLWVFSWSRERVEEHPRYITMGEKQEMERYFIGRAVDGFVSQNGRRALQLEAEYNSREEPVEWDVPFIRKII